MSPEERPCYGAPCSLLIMTCRQFLPRVPTALMLRVMPDAETLSQVTRAELSKAANQDKFFLLQVDSIRNFVPVKQRGTVGNSTRAPPGCAIRLPSAGLQTQMANEVHSAVTAHNKDTEWSMVRVF